MSAHATLLVFGDANANAIAVSLDTANHKIVATRDGESLSFAAERVARVRIESGDGADVVDFSSGPSLRCTIVAGGGNDTLIGGPGRDVLSGGDGDDVIDGGGGDDTLTGGAGIDMAEYHRRGTGFTFRLDGSSAGAPVVAQGISSTASTTERDVFTDFFETISGTAKADEFNVVSTASADPSSPEATIRLLGNGGDDRLGGGDQGSSVILVGGAGNDDFFVDEFPVQTIFGGAGDDTIHCNQTVPASADGGPGVDTLVAPAKFPEADVPVDLNQFSSIERCVGGLDPVIGTPGPDWISGHIVYGMGGNDTIVGGDGDDSLDGGAGNDSIDGGGGKDSISGGPGDDTITGGPGRDRIYGSDGNDTIFARDNSIDRVYGGGGNDRAQVNQSAAITDIVRDVETILA